MKRRMITVGCLIAFAGVLTVLNSKMSADIQNNESDNLSLYNSINSTQTQQKSGSLGESAELEDRVQKIESSVKGTSIEEVLSKDIHKLAQELRVDEDETYRLKELNNFRTPLKDIIARVDPEGYARFLDETLKKIHSCLEVNFCGMEKDSPNSPYFDEQNTVAHKTILRSLSALEMLIDKGDGETVKKQMDAAILERLLDNNNADVQRKAMQLLKKKLSNAEAFSAIMKHEKSFSGEGKAYFYEELSQALSNKGHQAILLDSLATTLETNDPHTVLSVVEKVPQLSIKKEEFSRLATGLCRFQSEPGLTHNWPSVSHQLDKFKEMDIIENDFNCL